jgi:hypothetical protein
LSKLLQNVERKESFFHEAHHSIKTFQAYINVPQHPLIHRHENPVNIKSVLEELVNENVQN